MNREFVIQKRTEAFHLINPSANQKTGAIVPGNEERTLRVKQLRSHPGNVLAAVTGITDRVMINMTRPELPGLII